MSQISDLQDEIRANNLKLGWRGPTSTDERTFVEELALIASELSEALEAFRISGDPTAEWVSYSLTHDGVKFKNLTEEQVEALTGQDVNQEGCRAKPEGCPSELADAFIRLLDTCAEYGIDLAAKTEEKIEYNSGREFRHGGAHL